MNQRTWIPEREGELPWLHHLPRTTLLDDRTAWLVEAVRDKRVLHIGFVDAGCEISGRRRGWLHEDLARAATEIVGFDVAAEGVEAARRDGYEAYAVDCTDQNAVNATGLEPFDVVVLGEVIEHVANPGLLLEALKQTVAPGGRLVLTTPNANRLVNVMLAALRREILHPDHVAVYSPTTLRSLLERSGWSVTWVGTYLSPRRRKRPATPKEAVLFGLNALGRTASRVAPYIADGLILVAEPVQGGNK